jgi:hypothetical protein
MARPTEELRSDHMRELAILLVGVAPLALLTAWSIRRIGPLAAQSVRRQQE